MAKTKAQAFANHTGLALNELPDYRYHYGRTTTAVYWIDDSYYCVTKGNEKPAVHRDGMEFDWVQMTDNFAAADGFKIWISN